MVNLDRPYRSDYYCFLGRLLEIFTSLTEAVNNKYILSPAALKGIKDSPCPSEIVRLAYLKTLVV